MVILLLLGVFIALSEGARWIATYFALANAAAEGTRAGAFVPTSTWTVSDIDTRVRSAARYALPPWITLADGDITICRTTASATSCTPPGISPVQSGQVIQVTIVYVFQWVPYAASFLGQGNDTITAFHRERID